MTTDFATGAVANDEGGKAGRFSEDAWGQRRNPFTWSGVPQTSGVNKSDDGEADSVTPRGYTGHEMLDDLGLVHMNGRIYDPLLGRFLSADLVVQFPGSLQSYNRYSYVNNNPLKYTDPTGFYSFLGLEFTDGGGVSGFLKDAASYAGSAVMGAVGDSMVAGYNSGVDHMTAGMTEISNANGALDATIGGLHMVAAVGQAVGVVLNVVPGGKAESMAVNGAEKLAVKAETAVTQAVEKVEGKAAALEKRVTGVEKKLDSTVSKEVKKNGETSATAYGREQHKAADYGEGFQKEVDIGGGNRVDGLKVEGDKATVVELKPDNPRQIAKGQKQLDRYEKQIKEKFPDVKKVEKVLKTYPPLKKPDGT